MHTIHSCINPHICFVYCMCMLSSVIVLLIIARDRKELLDLRVMPDLRYVHVYILYSHINTHLVYVYIHSINVVRIWYRDLLVLMETLEKLEQQDLKEVAAPRDTKACVDPQAIREPKELEDHPDQLAPKETKYTHACVLHMLHFVILFRAHLVTLDYLESVELMETMYVICYLSISLNYMCNYADFS